jgi:hypothetical protein
MTGFFEFDGKQYDYLRESRTLRRIADSLGGTETERQEALLSETAKHLGSSELTASRFIAAVVEYDALVRDFFSRGSERGAEPAPKTP